MKIFCGSSASDEAPDVAFLSLVSEAARAAAALAAFLAPLLFLLFFFFSFTGVFGGCCSELEVGRVCWSSGLSAAFLATLAYEIDATLAAMAAGRHKNLKEAVLSADFAGADGEKLT